MKKFTTLIVFLLVLFLAACGNDGVQEEENGLVALEVEFNLPEAADPGETVVFEAIVTYGDEFVEDADEVLFEYWLKGNEAESVKIEGEHVGDGVYTANVTFDEEGIYEAYAHTTARGLHTMPLKSITVGDAEDHDRHDEHADSDGFYLHFMNPETVSAGEETDLIAHVQMDGEALSDVTVSYEIILEDNGTPETVEAEETVAGEYKAAYTFTEAGTYTVHIHVEDEDNLHKHESYSIVVE